jgi:hypothetical protein
MGGMRPMHTKIYEIAGEMQDAGIKNFSTECTKVAENIVGR